MQTPPKQSLLLFVLILLSCADETIYLYQRENRSLLIYREEMETQHRLISRSIEARDSQVTVDLLYLDTLEISPDTSVVQYEFEVTMPDESTLRLTAPNEGIFDFLGKKLPDFSLPNLDGEIVSIESYYDRPLVLNFWFRSCKPCKEEMPRLNEIKESYEDRVNFVAICLDDMDELKGFFKYFQFDYEHFINGREIAAQLNIKVYPKNIVVKKGGEVSQILDALLKTTDENDVLMTGSGDDLIREIEKVL